MPKVLSKAVLYGFLATWSVVCVFPIYWVAVTSLKSEADITSGPRYLPFVDFTPNLDSWAFLLADPHENLRMRFFNSAVIALGSTAVTLLLGAMLVYGVTRFYPSARRILAAVLATRILPPIVLVLPVYVVGHYTGLLDTRLGLIAVYAGANLPVAVWLLQPIFGAVATDQEEAAQLDGASRLGVFFGIVIPMAATGLAAVGLLIFILCWNEYLYAAILAGNNAMTLPPWLVGQMSIKEAQVGSEAEEWAHFSAATVLMAVPVLLFAAFAQRALGRVGLWRA